MSKFRVIVFAILLRKYLPVDIPAAPGRTDIFMRLACYIINPGAAAITLYFTVLVILPLHLYENRMLSRWINIYLSS